MEIAFDDVVSILFGGEGERTSYQNIILKSRLPQTLTAILAGSGLAISGLLMQTLFRNPLAGPSVLGISSGASLGVAIVVLASGTLSAALSTVPLDRSPVVLAAAGVLGASVVLVLILAISRIVRDHSTLLIVGLMVGYATSALVSVLTFYSEAESIRSFVFWGIGSFSAVSLGKLPILAIPVMLSIFISLILVKPLNAILLGEEAARSLGINTRKTRQLMILLTGVTAGAITAFCGPIAFLGLAVPHLARMLFKSAEHQVLLPAVALCGIGIALTCDVIARLPGSDAVLPLNVVTSLFGAPVVVWIILRRRTSKFVI